MTRAARSACLVLALGLVGVAAVLVLRRAPDRPQPPLPPAMLPRTPPSPPPTPPPAVARPPEPAPVPAARARHAAFDRLVDALRKGDRAKVRECLDALHAELVPPPIPAAENAALVYLKAFDRFPEITEEEQALLTRAAEGVLLAAEERQKIQALLERHEEALELLRKGAELPRCRFPVDYAKGVAAELPHLARVMQAGRLLRAEALLRGAPPDSLRAIDRLADSLADEPILVSQLVRSMSHHQATTLRERVLEGLPEADLRSLAAGSAHERVRPGFEKSLFFELYSGVKFILESGEAAAPGQPPPRPLDDPAMALDLAHYADTLSRFAELAGRPYYEAKGPIEALTLTNVEGAPLYSRFSQMLLPAMNRAAERQAVAEASLAAAGVAAAVRLHRQERGTYPASLDEVAASLPPDPFTGKPFLYRREGSGFVVYSAGPDGLDDGGVLRDRDVVFRSAR